MEYIHVRNLEKYHPGYKDRTLQWGKIFINMASGDPDTELISDEIDWCRFVKIILLELRAQKPLPNVDTYWLRKGFDLKTRPMSLTIQMLQNFLDIVTEPLRREEKIKSKIKNRVDKEEDKSKRFVFLSDPSFVAIFESYLNNRKRKATEHAKELILKDLHKVSKATAIAMLEQSIKNGWIGVFPLKTPLKPEARPQTRADHTKEQTRDPKIADIIHQTVKDMK
jgi:hypothetical protein